jgi:RimJ/RimL family protein N-acetyltransferase
MQSFTLPHPTRITTGRLLLRPLIFADARELGGVIAESGLPLPAPQAVIQASVPGPERWTFGIFTPSLAGMISVTFAGSVAELWFWLGQSKLGRGFALEAAAAVGRMALAQPGVQTLLVRCPPDHTRSHRVARRLGLQKRGTGRDGLVHFS